MDTGHEIWPRTLRATNTMKAERSGQPSESLWRDRIRLALMLLALALILGLSFALISYNEVTQRTVISGVVDAWSREQTEMGSRSYILWLTLDDGSKTMITVTPHHNAPKIGERIRLLQTESRVSGIRYDWMRE